MKLFRKINAGFNLVERLVFIMLLALVFAFLFSSPQVQAQIVSNAPAAYTNTPSIAVTYPQHFLSSLTVTNGQVSTNPVSVQGARDYSLQFNTVSSSANTSNTVFTLKRTLDGVFLNSEGTITLANTGTIGVSVQTNVSGTADSQVFVIISNTATNGGVGVTNSIDAYLNIKN